MVHTLHFTITQQQLWWTNPCRSPVEGTAGAVLAQFEVDSEWDGLTVMAVFENDGLVEQPEPVVWTGEAVAVPALALSVAGRLRVGLVGLGDDGNTRLTTRRMAQGVPVHPSAGTGGEAVDPDPALWEQILAIIGNLDDLDTLAKTTLVAAINEVARSGSGGSGTVDPAYVEQIVEEYLKENPPPAGKDGEDGYTPQKGVDYFTEEDVTEIAEEAAKLVTIDQVSPSQVVFPKDVITTYEVGKVKLENGSAVLVSAGDTLEDFFEVFMDEQNPKTTDPSVSVTFSQAKAYEVGTNVTPTYSAVLNPGSYSYGPDTGVTATAWSVTNTAGGKNTTASGSFAQFQVTDGISYKITATATHGAGAVPVTNAGNAYAAGQIKAGSKTATSGAVTGYRNTFYGTLTAKTDPSSSVIRGLTSKSGKALANGSSFTITVPVGALRVMFAYPATLRDVTSIKDVNGMNAEISSGFTKTTVLVEGANGYTAISYKVYYIDFATANDKANKFTVTI